LQHPQDLHLNRGQAACAEAQPTISPALGHTGASASPWSQVPRTSNGDVISQFEQNMEVESKWGPNYFNLGSIFPVGSIGVQFVPNWDYRGELEPQPK